MADDLFGSEAESEEPQEQPQVQQAHEDQHESLEDDVEADQGVTAGLFGTDDEEEDGQQDAGPSQRQASSDSDEDRDRGRKSRSRPQALGPPMDLDAPLLPIPPSNTVHLLRTTNVVGIQPRAFDPATHEREEEIYEDETGRARVRLASNAIVRWRLRRLPDGREVPESNARFVRWEDGSLQLFLGHEVLDVAQQDIRANNQYLFVLRGLIQGQCPLTSRLALRPASLESGLHKRLREAVDKRHVKVNKVATAGGLQNPELEQARREKEEEEKISSRRQLARKQDRVLARAYGGGGYKRQSRLSDRYMEEEQDWEADQGYDYDDGLTADQRARLSMARTRPAYDEQAEAEAGRRLQAAKRGAGRGDERGAAAKRRRTAGSDDEGDDSEDEEEEEEYDDEDEAEYESSGEEEEEEEEEEGDEEPSKKKDKSSSKSSRSQAAAVEAKAAKPRRKGVVLSDDDD